MLRPSLKTTQSIIRTGYPSIQISKKRRLECVEIIGTDGRFTYVAPLLHYFPSPISSVSQESAGHADRALGSQVQFQNRNDFTADDAYVVTVVRSSKQQLDDVVNSQHNYMINCSVLISARTA